METPRARRALAAERPERGSRYAREQWCTARGGLRHGKLGSAPTSREETRDACRRRYRMTRRECVGLTLEAFL
jgi:hypothetical protein